YRSVGGGRLRFFPVRDDRDPFFGVAGFVAELDHRAAGFAGAVLAGVGRDLRVGFVALLPQESLLHAAVDVVPRLRLVLVASARHEEVRVDAGVMARLHPLAVVEVLVPTVELAAVLPRANDDVAEAAVASREQALDDALIGIAELVADALRAR